MTTYWFLTSSKELRDYCLSEFAGSVTNEMKLQIVTAEAIISDKLRSASTTKIPKFSRLTRQASSLKALCLLNQKKSKSLGYQKRADALFKNRHLDSVIIYSWEKLSFSKRLIVKLFSNSLLFKLLNNLLILLIQIESKRVAQNLPLRRGDVVIYPYSAYLDGIFDSWMRVFKNLGVISVAYQSNWDNMSSKCFISEAPNYFCVWGNQSAAHLLHLHEIKNSRIRIVGSPRFNTGFWAATRRKKLLKGEGKPFTIFVAGTGDGVNDYQIFESTVQAVNSIETSTKPIIIYRPHPFTRSAKVKESVIDYFRNIKGIEFLLLDDNENGTDYTSDYVDHLHEADLLVSHLSTLCLESLLLGTPVCIPLFIDQTKSFNWKDALDGLEHYKGMRVVSGLFAPETQLEFIDILKNIPSVSLDARSNLDWFCAQDSFVTLFKTVIKEAQTYKSE